MKRLLAVAPLAVAFVLSFVQVQACGPDFAPDVFVHSLHADNPKEFAGGKLGVLLPTYPRTDLTAAYRYLSGGALTAEEQGAYEPTLSFAEQVKADDAADAASVQTDANGVRYAVPQGPADRWVAARNRYAPPQSELHPVTQFNMVYSAGYFLAASYENCQEDAFRTAIATLKDRAKTWGAQSAELADWIKGQDAVFSNCSAGSAQGYFPEGRPVIHPMAPPAAAADAPILLRQDRAYQMGAAQFYAAQFEPARAQFEAVAQDAASPWRGVARYMVARTLIREAFLKAKNGIDDGMASFDAGLMKQAQRELESMRGERLPGISADAVVSMLNLVRMRTEPDKRLREISAALAGPKADPDFEQDMIDLNWYLNGKLDSLALREDSGAMDFVKTDTGYRPPTFEEKKPSFEKAYDGVTEIRSISPLIDWLVTFQSPAVAAKKHALEEWKRTGSTPWLVAAVMKAAPDDAEAPALIEAAARVAPQSPAWATVAYHRLRLLAGGGSAAAARAELEKALPGVKALGSDSADNLYTGLRMRTAANLDEALADAPRKILERTSEEQSALDECADVMRNPKRSYDCREDNHAVEFSDDAAAVFNGEMPLAELARAAKTDVLPPHLKSAVAMMAWVRGVLLKNEAIAEQMLPLLPQKLQRQAGAGVGFHSLMTILRNPGLRPYVDAGVQRSASYDFVESYSDNWWCGDWTQNYSEHGAPVDLRPVAFLSRYEQQAGEKETAALKAMGSAEEVLGARVLEYARMHPDDRDIPEALYLTLRTIRYGCYHGAANEGGMDGSSGVGTIARAVGALMRERYAANPWTKKAAPYVWPVKKDG